MHDRAYVGESGMAQQFEWEQQRFDLEERRRMMELEDQEELNLIEKQLKRRFVIGSQVSEHAIIQDFVKQKHNERAVMKVLHMMLRRGEIQHRMQRKMLFRVK